MQNIKSLEKQIYILEQKVVNCTVDGKLTKSGFAIAGKLKKVKKQLEKLKNEMWEAQ